MWSAEVGSTGLEGSGNLVVSGLNGSVTVSVPTVLGSTGVRYAPSDAGAYSETMDADHNLTVVFTTQYFVTVTASAGGTATPASAWVNASGQVSIAALANASSAFVNWSGWGPGAYNGTSASTVLTVTGPVSQVATFAPHTTSSTSSSGGIGTYALPIAILVALLVIGLGVGILIARSRGGSPPPEATADADATAGSETPASEEYGDDTGDPAGPPPE